MYTNQSIYQQYTDNKLSEKEPFTTQRTLNFS